MCVHEKGKGMGCKCRKYKSENNKKFKHEIELEYGSASRCTYNNLRKHRLYMIWLILKLTTIQQKQWKKQNKNDDDKTRQLRVKRDL